MCGKSFARADALRRHLLSKNKPRGCTGVRKEEDGNASSLDLNVAAGHVVGLVMEAPPNSAVSAPGDHYAHGFSYSGHHQPQHMDQMFAVEDQTSSAVSYDAGYTMMSRSLDNGLLHLSSDGYSASNLPFSPM